MYLQQPMSAYLCCHPPEVQSDIPDLLLMIGKLIANILKNDGLNPYSDLDKVSEHLVPCMRWIGDAKKLAPRPSRVCTEERVRAIIEERYGQTILETRNRSSSWSSVCWGLLKALSHIANEDGERELCLDLEDHARSFEKLAVSVLTECYRRDKFTAHQLLVRKVKFYNNITLFSLAFQYK
ncbi:hypothetical protein ScPMuIL_004682 [Solemya velum]